MRISTRVLRLCLTLTVIATIATGVYAVAPAVVNNSANISAGATVGVQAVPPTTTSCPSSGYGPSTNVAWGNVVQGTSSQQLICLQNSGTGGYSLTSSSMATTLPPSYGTITFAPEPVTMAPGSTLLVTLTWAVSTSAPTGPTTFTVTFS